MAIEVLVVGQSEGYWKETDLILSKFTDITVIKFTELDKLMEVDTSELNPLIAMCEACKDTRSTNEWVQGIKMNLPHVPLLVIYSSEDSIYASEVKKSGANKLVQRPYDDEFIIDAMLEIAQFDFNKKSPVATLEAIKLSDVEIGSTIDFDLYTHLPSNQKSICIRKKSSVIEQDVIDRVRKTKGQQLYVLKQELPFFFNYARKLLKQKGMKDTTSMTEKSVLLRTRIQNFMGIFLDAEEKNFDQGKEIVNEWESIIKELNVIQKIEHSEAFNMITSLTERPRTNYNAAINVAAYASLFAQVLDVPEAKWKNICLGGLLHNIGIARLPIHIAKTLPSLLNPEDLEFYKKYPTLGINLVKSKKVPIDPAVVNIVEQHAENCDGSGFPKGMRAVSICEEARIIAIAIAFNNLTSLTDESEAHTPMRAINMIAESNNPMKGSSILDFTMIKKIQSFFITQSKKLDSSFEDPGA